ncbi:MAG: GatB/YqeY domain-containing protein [Clostridia bacterium]|nr:GatB/YqeY domain-containing protein [Clostridia bacterium]
MSLKDQLMVDLKAAMKEKDAIKKASVTMLRAAIKQVEVDERIELNDDQIIEIVAKQIKQKKGAIEEFRKGERQDLVDETQAEIDFLSTYLPEQLGEDEIKALVEATIAEMGASSMKDMGKVMGAMKAKTAGRADNTVVSDLVKALLK